MEAGIEVRFSAVGGEGEDELGQGPREEEGSGESL